MKKLLSIIVVMILLATIVVNFSINCFALSAEIIDIDWGFTSTTIQEPKIDIQTIINEKVRLSFVNECCGWLPDDKNRTCYYNPSVYLIEYGVSMEYWDLVETMDYDGLVSAVRNDYPTIYVPLFIDIEDSHGEISTRVVGYIGLHYSFYSRDYIESSMFYPFTTKHFDSKENLGFYENIADYLASSGCEAQQVFVIRYPNSLSENMEKIAVIQTKEDVIILDISNSLHFPREHSKPYKPVAYSVEEYSTIRKEVEKEIYKTGFDWEHLIFGGIGNFNDTTINIIGTIWVIIQIVALLSIIFIILFSVYKKRTRVKREKSNQNN